MRKLEKFDKWLLVLGFLIVIGIFTLAIVLFFKGGLCAVDPVNYMISNNISIPYQLQQVQFP